MVQLVKQLFNAKPEAYKSPDCLSLLKFFCGELPQLAIELAGIPEFSKKKVPDQVKCFGSVSGKMKLLLKSFSANYLSIVEQALTRGRLGVFLFENGTEIAKCMLAQPLYVKKLGSITAKVSALYSQIDKDTLTHANATLRQLIYWSSDPSFSEQVMKKFYNEFGRECKIGGGSLQVQERLRICQDNFVELLESNKSLAF